LAFDLDVPDTVAGRDVLVLAERGDLGGMSFGFTMMDENRQGNHRELRAVELHEISVILGWPAYGGTVVHARNRVSSASSFRAYASRAMRLVEISK
jgi:HK97 family phage prohead protease